jgi:hypothetical protein
MVRLNGIQKKDEEVRRRERGLDVEVLLGRKRICFMRLTQGFK